MNRWIASLRLLGLGWALAVGSYADDSFVHQIVDPNGPHDPWVKITGDMNGDGRPDILIAGQSGPLVWYAWPDWRKTTLASDVFHTVDGEVGDLDRDGDLDVVIGAEFWYENPGRDKSFDSGAWKTHPIGSLRTHDTELADLDGDGDLDLIARDQSGFGAKAGNKIHFWRQESPDDWTAWYIDCPHGEGLLTGDVDRDRDMDVIAGRFWYENTGDLVRGDWTEHPIAPDWHEDTSVAVGDINGDGRPDAVLSRSEGPYRLSWFESPEDPRQGTWAEHPVDASLDFAHGIDLADLDRDGDLDIVTAEMHQSERDRVRVYLNTDRGSSWGSVHVARTGSHNLCTADFDGDGAADIMGANWSGDYQPIEVWLNRLSTRIK